MSAPEERVVSLAFADGQRVDYVMIEDDGTRMGRQCGTCSLCCKLIPVTELAKPSFTRCPHVRTKATGCCSIYLRRPPGCQDWVCRWRLDPEVQIPRPDRSHYVIDILPDEVEAIEDGKRRKVTVLQIWVDPAFPHAHRNPRLRAWLAAQAKQTGMPALVRRGSAYPDLLLVPPSLSAEKEWAELSVTFRADVGLWGDPQAVSKILTTVTR